MNMHKAKLLSWGIFVFGVAVRVMNTDVERLSQVGNMLIAIGVSWRLLIYVRAMSPASNGHVVGLSSGGGRTANSKAAARMFGNPVVPALCALFIVAVVIDLLFFIDLSHLMPLTSAITLLLVLTGITLYFVWHRGSSDNGGGADQASSKPEKPLNILEGTAVAAPHRVPSHDEHGRTRVERMLEDDE